MKNEIGALIAKDRENLELTQDQYGRKYDVSGPAIFKFERSYVKPSLDLWLKISKGMGMKEQKAVLMWVRAKLPRKYQSFIDIDVKAVAESAPKYGKGAKKKTKKEPDAVRKEILADRNAPKGLKSLLRDNDIWSLYKPETAELELLNTVFGQLGNGKKSSYREALRLVREFGSTGRK